MWLCASSLLQDPDSGALFPVPCIVCLSFKVWIFSRTIPDFMEILMSHSSGMDVKRDGVEIKWRLRKELQHQQPSADHIKRLNSWPTSVGQQ